MASEMVIEKSINIERTSQFVFDFLKLTRNQDRFSVWNMKDPNKETKHIGTDGTVGFVYSWNSKDNSVGAGSQKVLNIVEGTQIEYELTFERPMKNVGVSKFLIESIANNETKVTWTFSGPVKFPMSLMKGMIEKMLGKDISQSLDNLKALLEK